MPKPLILITESNGKQEVRLFRAAPDAPRDLAAHLLAPHPTAYATLTCVKTEDGTVTSGGAYVTAYQWGEALGVEVLDVRPGSDR